MDYEFRHTKESWARYYVSLKKHFVRVGVQDDAQKRTILLNNINEETYRLLRHVAAAPHVDSIRFLDLVELFEKYFKIKDYWDVEREYFLNTQRNPNASLASWAARLKILTEFCNYGDRLETRLVEQFITGLRPGPESDAVIGKNHTTLASALAAAQEAAAPVAVDGNVYYEASDFRPVRLAECPDKNKRKYETGDIVWTQWYKRKAYRTWEFGSITQALEDNTYEVYLANYNECVFRTPDQISPANNYPTEIDSSSDGRPATPDDDDLSIFSTDTVVEKEPDESELQPEEPPQPEAPPPPFAPRKWYAPAPWFREAPPPPPSPLELFRLEKMLLQEEAPRTLRAHPYRRHAARGRCTR